MAALPGVPVESQSNMQLNVLTLAGETFPVEAQHEWTVRHVKEQLQTLTGKHEHQQQLIFGSQPLSDGELLRDVLLPKGRSTYDIFMVVCNDEKKTRLIAALLNGHRRLRQVDEPKYLKDIDVVLAAMRNDGMQLEHASHFQHDRVVVFAALAQNGAALDFAGLKFQSDEEAVLAAVKSSAYAFTLADENLQNDEDFAKRALANNDFVFDYLLDDIKQVLRPRVRLYYADKGKHDRKAKKPNMVQKVLGYTLLVLMNS